MAVPTRRDVSSPFARSAFTDPPRGPAGHRREESRRRIQPACDPSSLPPSATANLRGKQRDPRDLLIRGPPVLQPRHPPLHALIALPHSPIGEPARRSVQSQHNQNDISRIHCAACISRVIEGSSLLRAEPVPRDGLTDREHGETEGVHEPRQIPVPIGVPVGLVRPKRHHEHL